MTDLTTPSPAQPIGRVVSRPDGQVVMVDRDWLQKITEAIKKINDHERRITTLEP